MLVMVIGGHDTTGYALAWTLIEVAKHPHVYEKIKEEMRTVLEKDTQIIDIANASKLQYLDWVIKEALRLRPSAGFGTGRLATEQFHYNGYDFPKGALLFLPIFPLMRAGIKVCINCLFLVLNDVIQDADSFVPERWSEDNPEKDRLKELFLPFAVGKRNCVGQSLATLELKVAAANLLKKFRFELVNADVKAEWYLTYKPADVRMQIIEDEL